MVGNFTLTKQCLARSKSLTLHKRQQFIDGDYRARCVANISDQALNLNKPSQIDWEEKHVKDQYRIEATKEAIKTEQNIAPKREKSQWQHCVHTKGGEHGSRGRVTQQLNPRHVCSPCNCINRHSENRK